MDFILENSNMGMGERNKLVIAGLGGGKDASFSTTTDEYESSVDTFKVYTSFLTEKDGLIKIIGEICAFMENIDSMNTTIKDMKTVIEYKNRIIMIGTSYQEQPGLIDPILPIIIPRIMDTSIKIINQAIKDINVTPDINKKINDNLNCLYQIIYITCKVRGFQTISKFFSSEVHMFENVINFLVKLPGESNESWYINYVLVLWTSILAMVPFDIDSIDTEGTLIKKLLKYGKEELFLSTNGRIITSFSLSKFLTRPDGIKKGLLDNYINEAISSLLQANNVSANIFNLLGITLSLCEIFKNGHPKDLANYVEEIITKVGHFEYPQYIMNNGIFRKEMTKLIQRVGLVMLKPRPQKWIYHIQMKSVLNKEQNNKENIEDNKNVNEDIKENDEILDYEIAYEKGETIIDYLIDKLRDKEYIVRWSGAKGLGRICERLTKELVEQIFHNGFDLFTDDENECAYHGACLCIAELCKRGMILPDRLEELIPYLEKALIYETNKGNFCTGNNVRDSACYIVWALARAYTTDIMKKYVDRGASTLILTILFDKEVNCRRAASAAFQENVGRQGNFPHGIEILTEADYFTLGIRSNCYLNIATFIAQYEEYYKTIVDYLSNNRGIHIERQIRELAADSLALGVPFNPEYFVDSIIPKLLKNCGSPNKNTRHGSGIGIGNILLAGSGRWDYYNKSSINRKRMLSGVSNNEKKILEDSDYRKQFDKMYSNIKYKNNGNLVTDNKELTNNLIKIISKIDTEKLYRGKGSEIMRYGINTYIQGISIVKLPLTPTDFIYYHEIIIDNIKYNSNEIQEESNLTLRLFNSVYEQNFKDSDEVNSKLIKTFLDMVTQSVTNENIMLTKGYTSAIVNFNSKYLYDNYEFVIGNLIKNSKIKKMKNDDAFTRKNAINAIGYGTCKMIQEQVDKGDIELKIQAILEGFEDYDMDPRIGDIGSNVRIACITNILQILLGLYRKKMIEIFKKFSFMAFQALIKQLSEKMASVRRVIGNDLQKFFYELKDESDDIFKDGIPSYITLRNIFGEDIEFDDCDKVFTLKWVEAEFSYKKIMPLILCEDYSNSFICGLIRSIACITEDVEKYSLSSLRGIFEKQSVEQKKKGIVKILEVAGEIFTSKEKDDKFIEPLESALVILLSMNMFISSDYIGYMDKIHKHVAKENIDSKNIHKILNSADIFYNLLFFEKETKYNGMNKCLRSGLIGMCHKYPVVRKKSSEKMFLFLSGLNEPDIGGIEEEEMEEANIIIADTDWTEKVVNIKENRNKLATFLNIKI